MTLRVRSLVLVLLGVSLLSFWTGRQVRTSRSVCTTTPGARRVLYYVDPMNPAFRSSEPGVAPCGMPLEPVYADEGARSSEAAGSAQAVRVRADRQQLIGVTVETARARTLQDTVRLLGRVAIDESRLSRVYSGSQGWVREVGAATTGSVVHKGELLALYYAPELASLQQTFLSTLVTYQRVKKTGENSYDNLQGGAQLSSYEKNLRTLRLQMQNLGMTPEQIEEIEHAGQPAPLVQVRAPGAGLVLSRNVSLGQRFEESTELYSIADLRRVWVLAEAFEGDARLFAPGASASVTEPGQGRSFTARLSRIPPRFDATTRRLELRLEADNPDLALRPDMFVDVLVPLVLGPALTVPAEAVLDSGLRRVAYVDKGDGVFEPRLVETGWRHGDTVQILAGLDEGDRVVTSGNFLLDAESRMRTAAALATAPADLPTKPAQAHTAAVSTAAKAVDPVCGMEVDAAAATAAGLTTTRAGRGYYFCRRECKEAFERGRGAHLAKGVS